MEITMRKAMMLAMLLFPLWLGAQTTGRVVWKVIFQVPYPLEYGNFYTAPIYVNGREVTQQTCKFVEPFTAEYSFEVKDGDLVEYRVEDPSEVNFYYKIRDHLDRLMACSNPSSPMIGETPAPVRVRLKHAELPTPAAFVVPIDGDTAYPLTGILEWSPPDDFSEYNCYDTSVSPQKLIRGYRVYWGKAGQEMELISEQNAALCWTMLEPMDPDTEYYWKVVPFNEHGEAQGCPTWKYRTTLFSRVARFNDFGGVADFDGDGCLDFLYVEDNFPDQEVDHGVIGYFRGFTGNFVDLVYVDLEGPERATWLDVDRDGDLDVVCYYEEGEIDFNEYAEEILDVKVFLNKDGRFDNEPLPDRLKRKYLIKPLHLAIKDSQPEVLKFADTRGNICCFVAMDVDGDGDADLLPYVCEFSTATDSVSVPLLPGHFYPHSYVSTYSEFEVLLNQQGVAPSPNSYENDRDSWHGHKNWADFDLDGDADLCFTAETYNYGIGLCDILRNDSGSFVPLNQALSGYNALDPKRGSDHLQGSVYCDVYWYDIDGDSDPDLIHLDAFGEYGGDTYILYLNQTIRKE